MGRILDSDGVEVKPGCTVRFAYGIPPVVVDAPIVERDGELIALTEGHTPAECAVADLEKFVDLFYVRREPKPKRTSSLMAQLSPTQRLEKTNR